ncbi:MAG TPA: tRNA (adenosine(37)-N6)-threonylcarbamoyltransferase complex ATPase subunit type 1 TsaE [Candidatus Marinimicrobia bacterium]|nr:tRNA (adenosine(37)-N6)-threonylcarbamoyltransferase complex ATPase subunit type 1 TsaE [Candidatus Neomarinimicrobiota bacterium]HRS52577.1 tRNA (adenosine(37)-N6)-threonylcarbamoyltransferase complex ATPase subunit type 1 TsaE [Candidatus Neomarinimicrobiota bacterium]HRU93171.1 tRNA (adenosine(37)-N6)-threonylcarbamoyltransferase complex ATPase subunit type 1 TsaE [Candidatus Neomarinimicrobiota bacterium]
MILQLISRSTDETIRLGEMLATCLKPGTVVALIGELAAGKTTLIKGICRGLGVTRPIESPTFTLVNEYPGSIYHIDCYREQRLTEWLELGINEYLYSDGITLIEWADRIKPLLPETTLFIDMRQNFNDDTVRYLEIQGSPNLISQIASLQTVSY